MKRYEVDCDACMCEAQHGEYIRIFDLMTALVERFMVQGLDESTATKCSELLMNELGLSPEND
jgi:hypothetical protein